jgi:8-oxo-dGTP pyrophosphatase MutT (NUDIX family)
MHRDPYTRLGRREVYRNPWLAVEAHQILHPSGASGEHLLIVTPQSCAVVVQDGDDLLFTRQPRFAAREAVIEIVKGGCGAGERSLDSAKRELREELGVTARTWSNLGVLREIPSIVDPPVLLFLARDLEFGVPEPAAEESIALVRYKIQTALHAAVGGEIDDAVTVAALFRFAATGGYITFEGVRPE